jgi:hypothetical protein
MEKETYTHFVPVGHTKETLVDSIKESIKNYPVNKVILVLGKNKEEESEKKARRVADEVKKELALINFGSMETDVKDVIAAANDLVVQARQEKKEGSKVVFNLSGSLRTLDIAGYIASLLTKSYSCVGIPDYKEGKASGIKDICPLPEIPVIEITKPKVDILELLSMDEWISLEELSKKYAAKSKIKALSKKSKTSFHLIELRKFKLIETDKPKKLLLIKLTKLGLLYYNAFKE